MVFKKKSLDFYKTAFKDKTFPTLPGVYLIKDENGVVLYVGKAKNLRKRLKQYEDAKDTRVSIFYLLQRAKSVDFITVSNEKEAFILENTLIKKHQPRYNLLLKDDKDYLRILFTDHKFPMVTLTRRKQENTFGPYTSSSAAKKVLEIIYDLFKLRQCSDVEFNQRSRPCILYEMRRCVAPCIGRGLQGRGLQSLCGEEEYSRLVLHAKEFLSGANKKELLKNLEKEMEGYSQKLEFERAKELFEIIKKIKHIVEEKQYVEGIAHKNIDVIGVYQKEKRTIIVILSFKECSLIASLHFSFFELVGSMEEILASFILQHYGKNEIPDKILLPIAIDRHIKDLLSQDHNKKRAIIFDNAKSSLNKTLLRMASKNAEELFESEREISSDRESLLLEMQKVLKLSKYPKTIFCFDTSFLSEKDSVIGKVVFVDGKRDKSQTRFFAVAGDNDYTLMKEAILKTFSTKCASSTGGASSTSSARSSLKKCDLLVLDGGSGQLSTVQKVLKKIVKENDEIGLMDVIAISKENGKHTKGLTMERVFLTNGEIVEFDKISPILFFLQQMRDEAHRVAISYHKKKRKKIFFQKRAKLL